MAANGPGFGGQNVEDRRKSLESYLQELTLIPVVKESMQFKLFLGIKFHFPEYVDGYQSSLLPKELSNTLMPNSSERLNSEVTISSSQDPTTTNFKIIGDLLKKAQ